MSTPGYVNTPSHVQGPLATHPMSVGEIFRGAIAVYKRNAKTIIIISALSALIALLFQIAGTATDISNHYYDSPRPANATAGGQSSSGLLSTILGTWFTAALLFAFAQGALGRSVSVGTSLKAGARRIGWLLLTNFLMVLAIVVALIPGAIIMGIGAGVGGSAAWVIATIGVIIMLTCALVVGMRLMLAPTITVMEEVSTTAAMSRSWHLTKGRFLQIFGIMVIFGVLFGILLGLSYGVGLLISHNSDNVMTTTIVAGLIAAIPTVFLSPLAHFVPAVCYVDQRIREENFAPVLENAYAEAGHTPQVAAHGPEGERVHFDD